MAKVIEFRSTDDAGEDEEKRIIKITDTVETAAHITLENMLEEIAMCNREISKATTRRNAIIDELTEIKTALSLSITVPSK